MLPAQPNQSLMDGLAILQAIATAVEPVGTRQLARELALEPTKVNRLVKTLAALGMVRQDEKRKYVAGPGIHVLAAQSLYASGLIRRALPGLEALHETGCTVALGVLWRDRVSYLYHGQRGMSAGEALGTTGLYPAPRSGIGMALLAFLPEEEVGARFPDKSPAWLAELAAIRDRRWAWVMRAEAPVSATLAVPVGDVPYAAIGLAGTLNLEDAKRQFLPLLQDAAARIHSSENEKGKEA